MTEADRDRRLAFAIPPIADPAEETAWLDPAEVWVTAQRLRKLGYGRHEVLHMLGAAMTPQLWNALQDQREYDLEAQRGAPPEPARR